MSLRPLVASRVEPKIYDQLNGLSHLSGRSLSQLVEWCILHSITELKDKVGIQFGNGSAETRKPSRGRRRRARKSPATP